MKKALMLASVASMIDQFNMSNIKILQNMGFEVHVAANFEFGSTCSNERIEEFKRELSELKITYYQIDFSRKIKDIYLNMKAYNQVKNLMTKNKYNLIHCHSPIGGVCGRIAAHKTRTKVIYTAHGFHYYKGAPLINWLVYYPIERWLARYTNVLITINKEDYHRAIKFKANKVEYVPGIGIDIQKFSDVNINVKAKRKELGVGETDFIILSVGELNKNKNHRVIISAIEKLKNKNINYVICGQGSLEKKLRNLSQKLGISEQIHFLGYRNDILEICKAADIFAFPSYREGLSISLLEAMASGIPVICSNIRGNNDLICNGKGGYLVDPNDIDGFAEKINQVYLHTMDYTKFSKYNLNHIKAYSLANINEKMAKIYSCL